MLIPCTSIVPEAGSGMLLASIMTADGHAEKVLVERTSLQGNYLDVGNPISTLEDRVLVELPHQATSGVWRIWIQTKDHDPDQS